MNEHETYRVSVYVNQDDYKNAEPVETNGGLLWPAATNEVKNARAHYPGHIVQVRSEQTGIVWKLDRP